MKKLLFALLSLSLLSMLPACCGCNWGCSKNKKEENGKQRRVKRDMNNNY